MHNYAGRFQRAARRQLNGKRLPGRESDSLRVLVVSRSSVFPHIRDIEFRPIE